METLTCTANRIRNRIPTVGLVFLVVPFIAFSQPAEIPADLIFYNARIWTVDETHPQARAIAIRADKIIAVGDERDILKHRGAATRAIDLDGAFVLPGFNDSHIHFASAAQFFWNIQLMDVNDDATFVQRVEAYAKDRPGEPIRGGGWGAYEQWAAGSIASEKKTRIWLPDRKLIDAITGQTPLFINRFDNAYFFVNSAALRNAGYTEDAQDDSLVAFLRDKTGRLTGVLQIKRPVGLRQLSEKFLGVPAMPDLPKRLAMSENALRLIREAGVTSVQDMSDHTQLQIYNQLLDEGKLTCRINFRFGLEYWRQMADLGFTRRSGNAMIRLGTVKGHIDGIMGTSTARFYEPYSNDPEGKNRGRWRPLTWISPDQPTELNRGPFMKMMLEADSANIQISVHAIGDEANGVMLDLVEEMIRANGRRDRRLRLVHAQVFAARDFSRLPGLDIIAEVQPFHLSDDMRWMEERIGAERCKGAYAFRSLQTQGATLCFGSDWPGTTASYYPIDPIFGIYAAVTRQTVAGKPAGGWYPDERISVAAAIRAYTLGSAYASYEESIKGTLAPGKLADVVVLDTDLLATPPASWLDDRGRSKIKCLYTIVNGTIVYKSEE